MNLRLQVLRMGGLTIEQVRRAVAALTGDDDDLARLVVANTAELSAYAKAIDEKIIGLIARRQPVAIDLRAVLAVGRRWTSSESGSVRGESPGWRSTCAC